MKSPIEKLEERLFHLCLAALRASTEYLTIFPLILLSYNGNMGIFLAEALIVKSNSSLLH